jgi:hypothetical protein
MKAWNPRYVVYASAHQRGPDEMLALDCERAPGGRMAPFIIWMSQRWQEWRRQNGMRPSEHVSGAGHAEFDAWLEASTTARLALVRQLAARDEGLRLIDLLCAGDDEQPTPGPPGQIDLFGPR